MESKIKPCEIKEPIVCKEIEQLKLFEKIYYVEQPLFLICRACGKQRKTRLRTLLKDRDCICNYCKQRQHLREKYGVENVSQIQSIQEKKIQTNRKKYGVDYYSQTEERRKRIKKILSEKPESFFQERDKKAKATRKERYGNENYNNSVKIAETWKNKSEEEKVKIVTNRKKTLKRKYGKENYVNTKKARETLEKHFGCAENFYRQRKEKAKQTNLKKYGCESPMQNHEIRSKSRKKYTYENEYFDSSWELAVWIWANDLGKDIKREPVCLNYDFNNEICRYFPDFEIDGELVEIKGDQFFEGEKMICPFDRTRDDYFEAKHRCMLAHNVHIWKRENVKEALDYVQKTYGRKFLKSFRN